MRMNKKGMTIGGMTEMILILVGVVFAFGLIATPMNLEYNGTLSTPINISAPAESYLSTLNETANTGATQTEEGEATETTANGLTLKSAWAIIKGVFSTLVNIVSGGWIVSIVSSAFYGLGVANILGQILRIFFILGLVYAVIRIFFRVTP